MPEAALALTAEERQLLVDLLELALKEKLVEEHHTRTRAFRELVRRQEDLIAGLLRKLGQPAE
jgi:hypothetical protein